MQGTQCVESKVGLRESIPLVAIGLEGDWPYIRKAASYIIDSAFLLMDYGHQRSLLKRHPFQWNFGQSSEAARLNCGFNCLDTCHLCNCNFSDWHVVMADAEWRGTEGNRRIWDPFKSGPNPMLTIPGLERDSIRFWFFCKWVSPPMQKVVLQRWNFESNTALCLCQQEILWNGATPMANLRVLIGGQSRNLIWKRLVS